RCFERDHAVSRRRRGLHLFSIETGPARDPRELDDERTRRTPDGQPHVDPSGIMPATLMPSAVPHSFRFILVEPRYGGNVGSAARALKNFGFGRLDLVDPRDGADHDEAVRMAVDAADLLEASRTHATLDAALEGAATVVGTSRRMGKHRQPHYDLHDLAPT